MSRETAHQQELREDRDSELYGEMVSRDISYKHVPIRRNIKIGRKKYSLRWILHYAQARNSGISCMYISYDYANDRMYDDDEQVTEHEWHEVQDQRLDIKLLWQARQYYLAQQSKGVTVGI